jgi:hypothetical protein
MEEDPLTSASVSVTPSRSSTALSTRESVSAVDEERQIIVESVAESSESSCLEEKSSPRFVSIYFKYIKILLYNMNQGRKYRHCNTHSHTSKQ